MSKLQELKNKLSPNGIEFRKLGEIGTFYGGLSGKNKYDFINGNAKFISYKNVFNNIEIDLNINDTVKVNETEAQNTIKYSDVLFTGSSETLEESGISSVVTSEPQENYYLNSFCFGLRFFDNIKILPNFAKYLFRCSNIRKQIIKCSQGVTRYNLSKKKMESIEIPIPPLEVQEEIVRILDPLTKDVNELIDLLKREQDLRKKQYAYYRDKLLTFEEDTPKVKLGEVCEKIKNINWKKENNISKKYIDLSSVSREFHEIIDNEIKEINSKNAPSRAKQIIKTNDILFGTTRPMLKRYCIVPEKYDAQICSTGFCVLRIVKSDVLINYIYHCLSISNFYNFIQDNEQGTTYPAISDTMLKEYKVPLPPLEKQKEIVSILDNLEKYYNNLQESLTVEIRKDERERQ